MLFFFLLISLANLAIGYIVAVKFHTTLFPEPTRERELVGGAPPFSIDATQIPLVNRQPSLVAILPEQQGLSDAAPEEDQALGNLASTPEQISEPSISTSEEAFPPTEDIETSTKNGSPEPLPTASMDDFMRGISDFRAQLSALDQRIRTCAKMPDAQQIEGCVQEFREANHRYLVQTSEVKDRLNQVESEAANCAREAIQQALDMQVAEVRLTAVKLDQLDVAADPAGSCESLLNTANALATTNDKLRDELALAQRELQPEQDPEEAIEPTLDELTQIPSRQMFDLELRRQLKRDEAFYFAIADVDHCNQLNLSYGPAVTDEILKAIARIVAASARGQCRAARYSGQQFAVIFPAYELADAAEVVERIRQIIHLTEFKHEDTRLDVSVSVTLFAGKSGELLPRFEHQLREGLAIVKSKERNQSFQVQAGKVEVISPPELDLQATSYEV